MAKTYLGADNVHRALEAHLQYLLESAESWRIKGHPNQAALILQRRAELIKETQRKPPCRNIDLEKITKEFFLAVNHANAGRLKHFGGAPGDPIEETAERLRAICASYLEKLDGGRD